MQANDNICWLNWTCNLVIPHHWDWRLHWCKFIRYSYCLLYYFILFYSNYQVGNYYVVDLPGSHTISFHKFIITKAGDYLDVNSSDIHTVLFNYSLILLSSFHCKGDNYCLNTRGEFGALTRMLRMMTKVWRMIGVKGNFEKSGILMRMI